MAKTVLLIRHGQGRHQTDGHAEEGLGPLLTELGQEQARSVQDHPIFKRALRDARRPLFVASNLARAVQTLSRAAPGRPIVVQPLVRERIVNEFDWPARVDKLVALLRAEKVEANLDAYYSELNEFGTVDGDSYEQYVRMVASDDAGLPFGLGNIMAHGARARQFITWMAEQEADTIVVVSHGAFMMYLDHLACKSRMGAFLRACNGRSYMDNCEVREYRLACGPSGWALSPHIEEEASISPSSNADTESSSGSSESDSEEAPRGDLQPFQAAALHPLPRKYRTKLPC